MSKSLVAGLVQLAGVVAMSVGFGGFDWRAGLVAGGASAVWLGLSIERS
jgi:hypothetical protein